MYGFLKRIIKKIISKLGYTLVKTRIDKNQGFYCRALSGLSDYNISINSDMTVSCNCNDSNNQGIIGDLTEQSLKQIFDGAKAKKIRAELSKGKIPLDICNGCSELVAAPLAVCNYHINNYHVPNKGIMVENCSICNYNCIYCNRNEVTSSRKVNIISKDNMEKIANEINENTISYVALFKLGEPFMDNEIYEKIKLVKKYNPDVNIATSTNGTMINTSEKIRAALLLNEIHFSIDGVNSEMQNKYQKGADFDKIMENVKCIIAQRGDAVKPLLVWKYVVFSWNDAETYILEAFDKAVKIGFDVLQFTLGGTGFDIGARSVRYYNADFIPSKIDYRLEYYEGGFGMRFDLRKKNGI